jgi:small subunit ribosomal protein S6
MAEIRTAIYEGLFLLNQSSASSDFAGCVNFLKEVLERAEAEVICLGKWDERKLAFPVEGQKRGTFLLGVFRVRGTQIANIERDCNLSDQVVRCLILRAEHLGEVELELLKKDAAALKVEASLRSNDEPVGDDADTADVADAAN